MSTNMAGRELNCSQCGKSYEVPPLKILKGFELADAPVDRKPKRSTNRPKILFAIGLLMCLLGLASGYRLRGYANSMIRDIGDPLGKLNAQADMLMPEEVLKEWYVVERNPELEEWRELPMIRYKTQGTILAKIAIGLLVIGGLGFFLACLGLIDGARSK